LITDAVVLSLGIKIMRVTIDLNNDSRGVADEIDDVRAHGRLPPERQPVEMIRLEITPQQSLGARHPLTKRLCIPALSGADC